VARLHSAARFAVVLALAVSTQGLLLAQAAWLTNQEWIAETLCVNPETDCDGKCQLKDRMEAMQHHGSHTHTHDEAPAPLLELALSVRAHVAERARVPAPHAEPARGPSAWLAMDTGREASQGVFHPPRPTAAA
jgi:hypothetical protein